MALTTDVPFMCEAAMRIRAFAPSRERKYNTGYGRTRGQKWISVSFPLTDRFAFFEKRYNMMHRAR